jgi:hypothetical protein
VQKLSNAEKLQALLKKQEALKNNIASLEARVRNEEDKKTTRMKILVGAYFMEKYKDKMSELVKMIDGFLTRDNDRKLFGLNPLQKEKKKIPENTEAA